MNDQSSKKKALFWRIFFIGLIIMLILGVIIGYGIWGKKSDKPNIKRLLTEVNNYIETIEKENANLKNQIKKMKGTVEKSIQSVESMKKNLVNLQDENTKLVGQTKNSTNPQKQKLDDLQK